MIKTEQATIGQAVFVHTWSDAEMMIRQDSTGVLYEDAYDLVDHPETYTETDIPIDAGGEEEATPEEIAAALEEVI